MNMWPLRLFPRRSAFPVVALAALIAAVGQTTLGGVVRVTGSGLGCPDWPLCHGKVIPPLEYHALIEYSHRLSATVVGFLVLALVFMAWRRYRYDRLVLATSTTALAVTLLAASLGGAAVLTELEWWSVMVHLGLAQVLVASIALALVATASPPPRRPRREGRTMRFELSIGISLVGLLTLTLLGSYMVGRGYGASCATWPLCEGKAFPTSTPFAVHMAHRYVAAFVGVLIAWTVLQAWNRRKEEPVTAWLGVALAALFAAQVGLGAVTVWSSFASSLKAFHLTMATLVWTALALLASVNLDPRRSASARRESMAPARSVAT